MESIPVYGMDQDKVKPGMYLCLFHGFKTPKERDEAENLGTFGPMIGPLTYVHTTYGDDIKLAFEKASDATKYDLDVYCPSLTVTRAHRKQKDVDDGCINFKGINYGDWTVSNFPIKE